MNANSTIGFGRINWVDMIKKTGVIAQEDDPSGKVVKLHFRFDDIDIGSAVTGQSVQFIKDTTDPDLPLAKKIVVLSDLARGAVQSKS